MSLFYQILPLRAENEQAIVDDLHRHQSETGLNLPMSPRLIATIENMGEIVNLELAYVQPVSQCDDWQDFTRRWIEASRHFNTPTTWARLSVALAQAEGLPAVEDRAPGFWEPYCARARQLLAEIAY